MGLEEKNSKRRGNLYDHAETPESLIKKIKMATHKNLLKLTQCKTWTERDDKAPKNIILSLSLRTHFIQWKRILRMSWRINSTMSGFPCESYCHWSPQAAMASVV